MPWCCRLGCLYEHSPLERNQSFATREKALVSPLLKSRPPGERWRWYGLFVPFTARAVSLPHLPLKPLRLPFVSFSPFTFVVFFLSLFFPLLVLFRFCLLFSFAPAQSHKTATHGRRYNSAQPERILKQRNAMFAPRHNKTVYLSFQACSTTTHAHPPPSYNPATTRAHSPPATAAPLAKARRDVRCA